MLGTWEHQGASQESMAEGQSHPCKNSERTRSGPATPRFPTHLLNSGTRAWERLQACTPEGPEVADWVHSLDPKAAQAPGHSSRFHLHFAVLEDPCLGPAGAHQPSEHSRATSPASEFPLRTVSVCVARSPMCTLCQYFHQLLSDSPPDCTHLGGALALGVLFSILSHDVCAINTLID